MYSVADSAAIPLIGRATELDRVRAAIERASSAAGSTLLLAGEEGIGKSRLAAEALVLARQRGFLTLSGTAYALHTDLAYAPVLEAIGPFLASLPAGRLRPLVRGLPDLSRLFGNLALAPPVPLGDPALERTRLFEAVARLVERMAADRPVAILIDDLHWADHASVDLLHYVARGLADQRVLLLGTYRLDEARADPRLRSLLRSLQRLGLADELTLPPLSADAVTKLASAVLAGEAPEALLRFLQDRAAGTPLYVTASIRGLRESGELFREGSTWTVGPDSLSAMPAVVHDLVLGRLERLNTSERLLVEVMAVAGDAASQAVIEQVGGSRPEELDQAAGRLRELGLLVEESAGSEVVFRATHPLITEVAYAELSESRRRRLHADVAAAMEAAGVQDPQRLAHHYRGAAWEVDSSRALEVLTAAATAVEKVHADAEASGYLAAALDLARIDHPDLIGELLERLGSARMRAGHLELAIAAWTEASRERQRAADWSALTHLRALLATAEWERGRFQEAEEHLSAALAMARDRAADAELVELYQIQLQLRARQADAAGLEEVLAALAETGGTPELMAATNLIRGYAAFLQGRFGDARDLVLVAADVAEKTGFIPLAARAQRQLATIAANTGDAKLCRDHLTADLALVARAGSPMLEVGARAMIMGTGLISDAWEESLTASRGLMMLSKRIGSPRGLATSLAVEAIVHAYRGEIVAARRSVAEARQVYGNAAAVDRHIFIFVEVSEAITALAGGDAEQARRFAAAAVAAPDVLPVLAFMVMGEAEVAANDPEAALLTASHLRNLGPKAPWPVACASWVDGLARAALGQRLNALACLHDAADRLEGLGFPYQEAKARLRWAEVAVGGSGNDGDASQARSEAAAEARRALINFDRLGARPVADRARRLLRDLGERLRPPPRVVTGDLSDRELQVVRLVAEGLSNNEIADRLFISPRTVTTHLQHVYQRLGLASRTALTRWALDRGLTYDNT
jgi:DNA-binding CsgD family transcriptional regulator/tetratricopeptide (TPR) repeat protein